MRRSQAGVHDKPLCPKDLAQRIRLPIYDRSHIDNSATSPVEAEHPYTGVLVTPAKGPEFHLGQ